MCSMYDCVLTSPVLVQFVVHVCVCLIRTYEYVYNFIHYFTVSACVLTSGHVFNVCSMHVLQI